MSLNRTVEPAINPVTLQEVKNHLRIEINDYDTTLNSLIHEAVRYVEGVTGRALISQTYEFKMDGFVSDLKIPKPPLISVSSVQYLDEANATQTLAAANYTVDNSSEPARLVESATGTYPSTYDDLDAVTITFVAGYGTAASDVPETFKRAIKLYIEKMYDMPFAGYGQALDNALESSLSFHRVDNISL